MLSHNSPETTSALQKDAMRIPRTLVLCWNIRDCSQTLRPTRLIVQTLNGDLRSVDCSSSVVCLSHLLRPWTSIGRRSEVSHPSAGPVKVAAVVIPDRALAERCACARMCKGRSLEPYWHA